MLGDSLELEDEDENKPAEKAWADVNMLSRSTEYWANTTHASSFIDHPAKKLEHIQVRLVRPRRKSVSVERNMEDVSPPWLQ